MGKKGKKAKQKRKTKQTKQRRPLLYGMTSSPSLRKKRVRVDVLWLLATTAVAIPDAEDEWGCFTISVACGRKAHPKGYEGQGLIAVPHPDHPEEVTLRRHVEQRALRNALQRVPKKQVVALGMTDVGLAEDLERWIEQPEEPAHIPGGFTWEDVQEWSRGLTRTNGVLAVFTLTQGLPQAEMDISGLAELLEAQALAFYAEKRAELPARRDEPPRSLE